ncbi:hypothetical protein EJ04DRAFT_513040 [Polyplosphaeria fusca]|uniref:Uncharacterized protein n=1 Tax=Polyplosphaeria fusca TaxID=682080 RepID=A0A9P4QYS0_9PLEO|nr:hypothetical protein EJ04DRAFT_513040 [Polyplosphaeria fusca]
MPSIASTLFAATAAIGLSAAAPRPVPWEDCSAKGSGLQWYTCTLPDFTFAGCCSIDPCTAKTCPEQGTPSPPTITTLPNTPTPTPSAACKRVNNFARLANVWRDEPYRYEGTTDHISISQEAGHKKKQNQVAVFDIPHGASDCKLQWNHRAIIPEFKVSGTGYTSVWNLNLGGKPWDQAVSPNGENPGFKRIEPLIGARVGAADFTNWDVAEGAGDHTVGAVACPSDTANLAMLMDLDGMGDAGEAGSVVAPQSKEEELGWYVSYCEPEQY